MGYIRRDLAGPTIAKWQYSLKFKNIILKHWPTRMEGPIKVFDTLFMYQNGVGVYKTPAHLKIYKLLGMKVKDLEAQNYKGIENTYMHVPGVDLSYTILQTQIKSYIEEFSPLVYPASKDPFNPDPIAETRFNPDVYRDNPAWIYDVNGEAMDTTVPQPQWDKDGWITTYLTYAPTVTADVPATIGDAAILGLVEAGDRNSIHFNEDEDHPLTFASILDIGNVLFENKTRIVQKTIEERTTNTYTLNRGNLSSNGSATSRYLKTAVIEYKFRRVKATSDPLVATLITKIETELAALSLKLNVIQTRWAIKLPGTFGSSLNSSVSKQLIRMYHHEVTPAETILSYNGYLKYDAMVTQKAKDFGKIFSKQIKQGHQLKKVKWYKKALVIILVVIIIIIAVLVTIFTYGAGASVSASLMYGALALMAGTAGMGALASHWAKNGDPAAARYAAGGAEFLGYVAMIVGAVANPYMFVIMQGLTRVAENSDTGAAIVGAIAIAAIIVGMYEASATTATEAALDSTMFSMSDMTMEEIGDVVLENIKQALGATGVSTSNMMQASIQLMNMSYNYYMTVIDPPPSIEAKQKELEASEKLLEDTSGPEVLDTVEVEYSDPYNNWIDMNEKMGSVPLMLTQGKNRLLMNKYYNSGY